MNSLGKLGVVFLGIMFAPLTFGMSIPLALRLAGGKR